MAATVRFLLAAAVIFASGCVTPSANPQAFVDDAGQPVDATHLDRIVVTSTDLAEIVLALGHVDRLAAVPAWIESQTTCVRPAPGLEDVPRIGKPHVILAESVVALQPSLVLEKDHPLSPTPLAPQLRQAGVDVFWFDGAETLENLYHTIQTVGRILERVDAQAPAHAEALVASIQHDLDVVASTLRNASEPTPRALFQFPGGLVAANGTSGHRLLQLAGAQDIAAGLTGYRQMSGEAIAHGDPERVVVSCTAAGNAAAVYGAPKFASTTAARLQPQSLLIVDPGLSGLVGPRFPQGVREAAEWLHPAAFGLVTPAINWTLAGRAASIDATRTEAQDGPLTYRLDAGDGSAVQESTAGTFSHSYGRTGTFHAHVYLIDNQGRIHEATHEFQVTA